MTAGRDTPETRFIPECPPDAQNTPRSQDPPRKQVPRRARASGHPQVPASRPGNDPQRPWPAPARLTATGDSRCQPRWPEPDRRLDDQPPRGPDIFGPGTRPGMHRTRHRAPRGRALRGPAGVPQPNGHLLARDSRIPVLAGALRPCGACARGEGGRGRGRPRHGRSRGRAPMSVREKLKVQAGRGTRRKATKPLGSRVCSS